MTRGPAGALRLLIAQQPLQQHPCCSVQRGGFAVHRRTAWTLLLRHTQTSGSSEQDVACVPCAQTPFLPFWRLEAAVCPGPVKEGVALVPDLAEPTAAEEKPPPAEAEAAAAEAGEHGAAEEDAAQEGETPLAKEEHDQEPAEDPAAEEVSTFSLALTSACFAVTEPRHALCLPHREGVSMPLHTSLHHDDFCFGCVVAGGGRGSGADAAAPEAAHQDGWRGDARQGQGQGPRQRTGPGSGARPGARPRPRPARAAAEECLRAGRSQLGALCCSIQPLHHLMLVDLQCKWSMQELRQGLQWAERQRSVVALAVFFEQLPFYPCSLQAFLRSLRSMHHCCCKGSALVVDLALHGTIATCRERPTCHQRTSRGWRRGWCCARCMLHCCAAPRAAASPHQVRLSPSARACMHLLLLHAQTVCNDENSGRCCQSCC